MKYLGKETKVSDGDAIEEQENCQFSTIKKNILQFSYKNLVKTASRDITRVMELYSRFLENNRSYLEKTPNFSVRFAYLEIWVFSLDMIGYFLETSHFRAP